MNSNHISDQEFVSGGTLLILISFTLRWSGFVHVVAGSRDHASLLKRVASVMDSGIITYGGMYESAPLYIFIQAIGGLVAGLEEFSVTLVVLIATSIIPIIIGALSIRLTNNRGAGLITISLAVPFGLFLRTGASVEADGVAVIWFTLSCLAFFIYRSDCKTRTAALFIFIASSSVFLHLLYSSFILGFFYILVSVIFAASRYSGESVPTHLIITVVTIGTIVAGRILWSGDAERAVWFLTTVVKLPQFGSVIELLVPTTEAASEGVGASGINKNSGVINGLVGGVLHVFSLAIIGAVGFIIAFSQNKRRNVILMSISLAIPTILLLIFPFEHNLSYRLYYFVGVVLLCLAGVVPECKKLVISSLNLRRIVLVTIIILLIPYFAFGPIVPIGNDLDPRFGGTSFATTWTDYEQFQSIDRFTPGTKEVDYNGTRNVAHLPTGSGTLTGFNHCGGKNRVWTTGSYSLCSG